MLAGLCAAWLGVAACAARPLHVLEAPPAAAFRVLGMVSGQGPSEAAAIEHAMYRASGMDADAIVVQHRHNVGPQWIVTVKVIKYLVPVQ
jgi:hypothetical protein